MSSKEIALLKKSLERQKKARLQAERILEEKSQELYLTAQQLKETNERLENLLSEKTSELEGVFINIVDPYVVMDLKGNVVRMNNAAKDFLGYDIEKSSFNLWKIVHPDYTRYTEESFERLNKLGELKNYRARIIIKDGSERFVQVNGSIIFDKDRIPIAAQGIIRDITKEEETERLLRDQRRELDIIVDNSPLGIVLTVKGKIIKANKAFARMLGYSEAELKKMHVKDVSEPIDSKYSLELMEKMNKGELEDFTVKKKYLTRDGREFWAKTSVSAVKDKEGSVEYQVALVEDITEQILLESQKEQLLSELETSNRELQDYAHIVSHDLKSPLRSLHALADWLRQDYEDVLDENGINNLQMMQEKIEGMDRLIEGILKYSSISRKLAERTNIDLNNVVSEIREIIFVPDNVSIVIMNTLPTIHADRTQMHQLFQNLIGNAVVNIEDKEGLVKIDFQDKDSEWEFSICDNGVGIPKEYHEKIFEIFQSVNSGKKSTGLGLSIVKKIVDLHGGEIWLESTVGKGTTFYFTIKKD